MKLKYICNNSDYKTLRNLFNNNLLLRNNADLITDSFIPRNSVYDAQADMIIELDELMAKYQLDLILN